MRICIYEAGEGFGGAVTSAALLAKGLRARGHDVSFVLRERFPRVGEALGEHVSLEVARPSTKGIHWYSTQVKAANGLHRALRELKPDVVVANNSPLANAAILGVAPWVPVLQFVRGPLAGTRLESLVMRRARRVVAVNGEVAEKLARAGWDATQAPEGIDPLPRSTLDGPLLVLSTLAKWKGHDLLLEAIAKAAVQVPGLRVEIAGESPGAEQGRRQELEKRRETLGIRAHVKFLGHLDNVPAALSNARALLLPSQAPEPFGRVVLEAFAAGVPVIASDGGEPARLLRADDAGLLVPMHDVDAWARALATAWIDDASIGKWSLGARRVADRHPVSRMVDVVEHALQAAA